MIVVTAAAAADAAAAAAAVVVAVAAAAAEGEATMSRNQTDPLLIVPRPRRLAQNCMLPASTQISQCTKLRTHLETGADDTARLAPEP